MSLHRRPRRWWSGALLVALLTACAERPLRYDVPPPSQASRYTVEVSVSGKPSLTTPVGLAGGALGGALAGGYNACILSFGTLCAAAPVAMPLGAVAGLALAETPSNIARLERGLRQQDIVTRVAPCLRDAIVEAGNRRHAYHFVAAELGAAGNDGERLKLLIEPLAVGLTQGSGEQVFTLEVRGRLEQQEFSEVAHASAPREIGVWLIDDGKAIAEAMTEACAAIAQRVVTRVLVGR